jgi:hypothetical protein
MDIVFAGVWEKRTKIIPIDFFYIGSNIEWNFIDIMVKLFAVDP